jgi:hypothetical protein
MAPQTGSSVGVAGSRVGSLSADAEGGESCFCRGCDEIGRVRLPPGIRRDSQLNHHWVLAVPQSTPGTTCRENRSSPHRDDDRHVQVAEPVKRFQGFLAPLSHPGQPLMTVATLGQARRRPHKLPADIRGRFRTERSC